MDVNDVKTISDAIECLTKHRVKWSISIAVDCEEIDTAVEYVFDLVLEAAKNAENNQCVLSNVCRLYRRAEQ